ncbi:MAG: hypothetical protein AABY18_00345 [Candidatus Thermoplasmatota archaeon]
MRAALFAVVVLMIAAPTQAVTLFFVGDGSATNVAASQSTDVNAPMSPAGHGNKETSYQQLGVQDESAANNGKLPTFTWPEPVSISAAAPVVVHMFVEDPWGAFCGGMDGQLFDLAGAVLGPAGGLLVDTTGGPDTVEELVFSFEGISGEFPGLQFQIGGHWSDCSSLPYTFYWGADAVASRLDYVAAAGAPVGPTTTYTNLTTPHLALGFVNATSGTYLYNFTNALAPVDLDYNVTGNGTAQVIVRDGAGAEVFNQTFPPSLAGKQSFAQAKPGNWTYEIVLTDFAGTLSLDLATPATAGGASGSTVTGTASTTGTNTASASTGGTAADSSETTGGSADAPGPAPAIMLVAVALVAWVSRRRMQ